MLNSIKERIEAASFPEPNSGCWLWIGAVWINERGPRGKITVNGVQRFASRVSYEAFNGPLVPEMRVCHRCDTPLCVNPEHLFLGTALDNSQDMVRKGRGYWQKSRLPGASRSIRGVAYNTGIRNGRAKLNDSDVIAILASDLRPSELARRYGVNRCAIRDIKAGRTWKHLSGGEN